MPLYQFFIIIIIIIFIFFLHVLICIFVIVVFYVYIYIYIYIYTLYLSVFLRSTVSVLCYLYAPRSKRAKFQSNFNSLYVCTVHVAKLTIKQTMTLTLTHFILSCITYNP